MTFIFLVDHQTFLVICSQSSIESPFIVADFIREMIGHDQHHITQIENFLAAVSDG